MLSWSIPVDFFIFIEKHFQYMGRNLKILGQGSEGFRRNLDVWETIVCKDSEIYVYNNRVYSCVYGYNPIKLIHKGVFYANKQA